MKGKVGRPATGQKPVLAIRIPEPLYRKIAVSAKKSGKAIAEEAIDRIERSFRDDEIKKFLSDYLPPQPRG